jgi:anti-sigma factor ChrR (cupin superfamily)
VLAGLRSRRVEYFELSYQIGMLTTFLVMDSVARQNLPIGPVDVGRVTEEIAMLSSKLGRVRTQQATHAMLYQPRLDTLLVMTQQLYPARAQTDPTMPAPPPYSSS